MRRAVLLLVVGLVALGAAIPMPEPPTTQADLLQKILNAMPEDNDLVSTNEDQEPPQSKEEMPSGQDQVPAVPSVQVREPTIIELPSSYEPGPQPQDTDDQHQQKLVPQVEQVHTDTEPELLQPDQEVEQPEQQVGEVFVQPEPEAEQQVDEVVVQPEPQVDEVFIEPEPQVDEIFIEPEPQVDEVFIEPEPQMDEKFIEQEPQMDEVFIEPEPQVDELFVEPELQVDGVFIEPEPQMDEVFVEPEPQMDEEFIEQEPQMDEVFIEPEPQVDELFVEPEPQVDGVFIEPEPQMDEVFIEPGTQVDEVFIEPEIDEVFIEPEMDNVYIATEGDDRQEVPDPDDDLEFVVDNIAEDYEEVEPQENPATFDKAGDFLSWFIPYLKPEEEVHVSSEEILSDEPNPDTDVMILSLYEADTDQTPPGVTLIDETAAVKEDSYPIDHDDGLGEEMILSDFELLGEQALPVNEESTVMEGHPMLKDSPIMAVAFDISHPYDETLTDESYIPAEDFETESFIPEEEFTEESDVPEGDFTYEQVPVINLEQLVEEEDLFEEYLPGPQSDLSPVPSLLDLLMPKPLEEPIGFRDDMYPVVVMESSSGPIADMRHFYMIEEKESSNDFPSDVVDIIIKNEPQHDSEDTIMPVVGERVIIEERPLPIAEFPEENYRSPFTEDQEPHWRPNSNNNYHPIIFPDNNKPPKTLTMFPQKWGENPAFLPVHEPRRGPSRQQMSGPHSSDMKTMTDKVFPHFPAQPEILQKNPDFMNSRATLLPADTLFGPNHEGNHVASSIFLRPNNFQNEYYEPSSFPQSFNYYNTLRQASSDVKMFPQLLQGSLQHHSQLYRRPDAYSRVPRPNFSAYEQYFVPQHTHEQNFYPQTPSGPDSFTQDPFEYYGSFYSANDELDARGSSPHFRTSSSMSFDFDRFKRQPQYDVEIYPVDMTFTPDDDSFDMSPYNSQYPGQQFLQGPNFRTKFSPSYDEPIYLDSQGYPDTNFYPSASRHNRYEPNYFFENNHDFPFRGPAPTW